MKKNFLTTLIAFAAIVTSCNDNLNLEMPDDGAVRISSSIGTRVVGTAWEANDAIGVYMNAVDGTLGALGANAEYVTAIGDGNFTSTDPLYYPESGNVDFFAYYPYVDDVTFDATAYSVNVSSQKNLSAIDLMTASASNVENSAESVYMDFTHKLSSIKISISAGDGWSENDLVGLEIKLIGTESEASYNLTTDAIQLNGSVADITLNTTTDGSSAEGIVIPQSLSGARIAFVTASRGTFELSVNTDAFLAGTQYTYSVEIDLTGATLINATIDPWLNETVRLGGVEAVSLSPSSFNIAVGDSGVIVLNITPSTVTEFTQSWSSSDESIVTVSQTGTITAIEEGNATITVSINDGEVIVTCAVAVKSKLEMLMFNRAILWEIDYNPFDIADYGYKGSTGDTIESAYPCYFMVLSSGLYLDDYYIAGADNYFIKMKTAFAFDDNYVYTLGSYYFVDYEAVDVNGNPEPYRVQACEFNADVYTAYFQAMFDGGSSSSSNYPYLRDNDSEIYFGVNKEDQTIMSWLTSGFIAQGGNKIEFSSGDSPYYTVEHYDFNATFFGNPYTYGLEVDEYGDYVYPLTMEPTTTVNLSCGTSVYSAPAAQNAPQQLSGKIDRVSAELQVAVNRLTLQPLATKLQDASFKINK